MLMFDSWPGPALIYDVSDPLRPTLRCVTQNTTAHLFTGDTFVYLRTVSPTETDVVLHSIGSGNESVATTLPVGTAFGAWVPNGSAMAYTVTHPPDNQYFGGSTQVWVSSQNRTHLLYTYSNGIGDCICRFGLPPQQLAFSSDGQYLVSGWIAGKGSDPLAVYRISDGARVLTADPSSYQGLWDRTGDRLFLVAFDGVRSWTPAGGLTNLSARSWRYDAGLSPDGLDAAYTDYPDQAPTQIRVHTYNGKTGADHLITDAMRSQAVFVKDGWVWYLEEAACSNCTGTTGPDGKVFGMDLSTGVEQQVAFAAGDDPISRAGDIGSFVFRAPEFWPNS